MFDPVAYQNLFNPGDKFVIIDEAHKLSDPGSRNNQIHK